MIRGTIRQRSKIKKDPWNIQIYLGVNPTPGGKRYHSETIKGTRTQAQRRLTELIPNNFYFPFQICCSLCKGIG